MKPNFDLFFDFLCFIVYRTADNFNQNKVHIDTTILKVYFVSLPLPIQFVCFSVLRLDCQTVFVYIYICIFIYETKSVSVVNEIL